MSNRTRAALLSLLAASTLAWSPLAAADRGYRGDHGNYGNHGGYRHHGWEGHHHRHDHGYRDHSGAALGATLALGAGLLWLSTRPSPPSPPPVYLSMPEPAPVIIAPPTPSAWYYCRAAGAYYPYVQTCQMPWEIVPAN